MIKLINDILVLAMSRKGRAFLATAVILLIVVFSAFWGLTETFYQQDEWMALGNILVNGPGYIFLNAGEIYRVFLGQGRLLSSAVVYLLLGSFPFNSVPITIYAVSLHLLNSLLLFILIYKLLRKLTPAFFGALVFGVSAVSHGAVTWSAAAVGTLSATTLILASLFLFFKGIGGEGTTVRKRVSRAKWLFLSLFVVYISLLFKEIGIFLFFLLPVFAYIFMGYSLKSLLRSKMIIFVLVFLGIALNEILQLRFKGPYALFLAGDKPYFFETLAARLVLYPTTSFSLTLIPPENALNFARFITNIYYPFFSPDSFILIAQTAVLDLIAILFSVVFLLALYLLGRNSQTTDRKLLAFFTSFVLASFLPYIVISKSFAYLESRYYYLAVLGMGFVVAWVARRIGEISKVWTLLFTFGLGLYILAHFLAVRSAIEKQISISSERTTFLSQLRKLKPALVDEKNAFFITGDADFYLPGNKVPFQQGMGYTLLVWYYNSERVPKEFITDKVLFELGSQGYYEYEGMGFGYFSDLDAMKKEVESRRLNRSAVIGLYYDAKSQKLKDISQEVIDKL